MTRQIFFDTETTGLSPDAGDRIVEIGCVEFVDRRPTGNNKHFYVNPERPGSEEAIRVHGLTDAFLADKPVFAVIADELMDYLRGAEVLIHNAGFDVGFMDAELRRVGQPRFAEQVALVSDTLTMAREMFPGKANSLDALCKRLEVDNSNRTLHGALLDAGLLAEVYIQMTRGQKTLVIDAEESATQELQVAQIDLSQIQVRVVPASEAEREAHERVLEELDKSSKGHTLWRKLVA